MSGEVQRFEEGEPDSSGASRLATDGLSKTCFGKRFVVDPAKHLLVDVPGKIAIVTGEKAMDTGMAGVSFALDLGRKGAGAETQLEAEPREVAP